MTTAQIREIERVKFLWGAGHIVPNKTLAQHMAFALRCAASSTNLRLADSVSRRICPHCSSLLMPGINCKVRLCKRREAGNTEKGGDGSTFADARRRMTETGNLGVDAGPGGTCAGRIVARKWWDGFSRGAHSAKRNDLVCTCNDCGKRLCFGGTEPSGSRERRERRGRDRRGQRFRMGEKATQELRLDKAAAFIEREGLAGTVVDLRQDKKKSKSSGPVLSESGRFVLPATMTDRAEAVLEDAYVSKAITFLSPGRGLQSQSLPEKSMACAQIGNAEIRKRPSEDEESVGDVKAKKKKKKQNPQSLEGKAASLAPPPAGGAGRACGSSPGGKKSLYDLMQEMLGS